jgi:N utilization substance protein A
MSEIKFDDKLLRVLTLFENVTKTRVKDCIERSNTYYFIVEGGELSKAIGKNGSNVKQLRKLLKKNIHVIEYSSNTKIFIKNIFHDFTIKEINIEDKSGSDQKVAYVSVDIREKGKIIGRDSRNLTLAREIMNRYSPIDIVIV